MSTLLRIVWFGLFAAAGVGLAVFLATSGLPMLERAPQLALHGAAPRPAKPRTKLPKQAAKQVAERPAVTDDQLLPVEPIAKPALRPARPAVAQQAEIAAPPDGAANPEEFLRWAGTVMQQMQQTPPALPGQAAPAAATPAAPRGSSPAPIAIEPPAEPTPPAAPKTTISDVQGEGDGSLSIMIQGEDIRRVMELLSEQGGLNILTSKNVTGTVSASLKHVSVETALDAILKSTGYIWHRDGQFIYVGTAEDFTAMRRAEDHIGTRLYRPNYVKAADLQTLITPLLTTGVGTISVSVASEVGIASDGTNAGGDAFAGREALLVRDYEAVLIEVDHVVQELDCPPTQVAIEAMVLSVALSDGNNVGVDFQFLRNTNHIRVTDGTPLASLGSIDYANGGLKVGFLDSSLAGLITALETIGDTNVIATPRLMCLNKHRAEILIGSQLGYVSTTQTETSTTQSVEFLEVGTQLRIRPFISSDGMVRMEVHPELSTGSVTVEQGFTLPNKEVTQVTTNVMVRDGNTVIIGGLLRDETTTNSEQIPLLGSLPYAGPLFRHKTETIERREILVLLTPRIVSDRISDAEGDQAAREFHHRQMNYADQMMPLGKRYIGRKYFRRAQEAWAAGKGGEALRLVNLAIHFDPMSRAALDLRNDIALGRPVGDHTAPFPADEVMLHAEPLPGEVLEGQPLPHWLLENLEDESAAIENPRFAPDETPAPQEVAQ